MREGIIINQLYKFRQLTRIGVRRHDNSKSGQITVLLASLIFLTVLFLGITLNIAELFVWHGHLQTSVDCAVFSGAVKQAGGLNKIAKINNEIVEAMGLYRSRVWNGGHAYSSKSTGLNRANSARHAFLRSNDSLNAEQQRININASTSAVSEARRIAGLNEGSGEFISFPSMKGQLTKMSKTHGRTMSFSFKYTYYVWVRVGEGRYERRRRTGTASGPSVSASVFKKSTSDHTYFCGRLLKPAQEFVFRFRNNDGKDLIETAFRNLRTYATAMPYGGRLWNGSRGVPRYDVKLVNTGAVNPRPDIPDKWGYDW